ncbi:MAG: Rne/Rng family ribonuclease [Rickettsiales bacterium]|nr:Rne/Rng family ribonuclease [Rickettsiales bacterium]|tara:strand:+ start:989 stop:2704 length:1716 start_codon:yes stop_codon:yes gene_type:complete
MGSRLSVDNALLLNRTAGELRAVLVQGGLPTSFYVERNRDRGIVGNIYKGRVVRIVPGMQAAFVELGLDRAGFLYVGDVAAARMVSGVEESAGSVDPESTLDPVGLAAGPLPSWQESRNLDLAVAEGPDAESTVGVPSQLSSPASQDPEVSFGAPGGDRERRPRRIQEVLRSGQEIVVQVRKEALGSKGPRLTTSLSVPGRFLVYVPGGDKVGVSRRITDEEERERLRDLVEGHQRQGEGFIVRTACEGVDEDILVADMQYLRQVWTSIEANGRSEDAPGLLHQELDLALRATRDMVSEEIRRVVVDDAEDERRIAEFMARFMPRVGGYLELYQDPTPMLEAAGVERVLQRVLRRRVHLPSGGYLVVEKTEALTSIDVNSGRYVSGANLEETTLKVNLEAVDALLYQLRLRDIGGLIIIDFIDMEVEQSRSQVEAALEAGLARDPARSSFLPISEFGLVEMTRRRVREDIASNLQVECRLCDGSGRLKSRETVAYEVLREIARNVSPDKSKVQELSVRCEPSVAAHLRSCEEEALSDLAEALGSPVDVVAESSFHRERFTVSFQVKGRQGV